MFLLQERLHMTGYAMSAGVYDVIYTSIKDYKREAETLRSVVSYYETQPSTTLLDVACGTGLHLSHLQEFYEVQGIDLSAQQLQVASTRLPNTFLLRADMRDFFFAKKFDVVTCLFSAIGHMLSYKDLCQAIANMATHLNPGGILIVEPWLQPAQYVGGTGHSQYVDTPELKVVRMNRSKREGNLCVLEMHHMVMFDGQEPQYFVETILAYMYTLLEYQQAFEQAGLQFVPYANDLAHRDRGLFVGIKH